MTSLKPAPHRNGHDTRSGSAVALAAELQTDGVQAHMMGTAQFLLAGLFGLGCLAAMLLGAPIV